MTRKPRSDAMLLDLPEEKRPLLSEWLKVLEDSAAKARQQWEVVKKSGGLSDEALRQIEEAARLL